MKDEKFSFKDTIDSNNEYTGLFHNESFHKDITSELIYETDLKPISKYTITELREISSNKSINLKRIIAAITSNPAKILAVNKGSLDQGNEADLCIFDINKPWVVDKDKIKSKSKNTPIENKKLQGQVLKTFVKGELAYENN